MAFLYFDIEGKTPINISVYPACNLICVLFVSCIYSYIYVSVLIVCTPLLGGNKEMSSDLRKGSLRHSSKYCIIDI